MQSVAAANDRVRLPNLPFKKPVWSSATGVCILLTIVRQRDPKMPGWCGHGSSIERIHFLPPLLPNDSRLVDIHPERFDRVHGAGYRRLALAGSMIAGVLLSGCSNVPDAVNPVEWYKGTVKFFSGEDRSDAGGAKSGTVAADAGQPPPGTDRPFPNLSTVPERPRTTSSNDRQQVVEGLVADRDAARYSSEVIRRQSEVVNPLAPPGSAPGSTIAVRPSSQQGAAASVASPPPVPPAPPPPTPVASVPATVSAVQPIAPAPASQPPSAIPAVSPKGATVVPAPAAASMQTAALQDRPPASVEETFRARLVQQQQLPVDAARNSLDAAGGYGSPAAAGFETIVVSSEGVRTGANVSAVTAAQGGGRVFPPSMPVLPLGVANISGEGESKIATIMFADGSSRLGSDDARILRAVSAIYRERGGRVVVVGHASSRTKSMDSVRHRQINQQMSAARAKAVADALVSFGVPRNVISVDARADTHPMYHEVMPSGEAGNRRAEIFIES